jgi:hypothetical protein
MLKKVVTGWNAAPDAPANWQPDRDGYCAAIPIRVSKHSNGSIHRCESAREPMPAELERLNAGGQLVLRVLGWQVPVALYVEPPPKDDSAPHLTKSGRKHAHPDHWLPLDEIGPLFVQLVSDSDI